MTQAEFKCDVCGKDFFNRQILLYHKETVHDGVIHRCKICDAPIRSKANMPDHMKRMHGNGEFSCDKCNYKTKTKRRLKVHIGNVHVEKKFECKFCDTKYGFQFGLNKHIRQVHAKTLPENKRDIATCPFCDFKSTSVKKHIKKLHKKREKLDPKFSHKCEFCNTSFTRKDSLSHHLFRYHRSKLSIETFKKKQCWDCPDCEFITVKVDRGYLERHVKQKHKKQLGKVILRDIFPKNPEIEDKQTEFCSGEYFEPKEETISQPKLENFDLDEKLDISDEDSDMLISGEYFKSKEEIISQPKPDISDEDSDNEDVMKNYEQVEQHSYLCPITSCTFVMSFYDEATKNKHFETQHDGEINWPGVSFIKL